MTLYATYTAIINPFYKNGYIYVTNRSKNF